MTDVEAETPILWPPDVKNWLIGKDPHAGKDWRQEEKGMTEDEMVGWHHWLDGHESEQAPGVGDGQGSLVCCSPWGHKESDWATELYWIGILDSKQPAALEVRITFVLQSLTLVDQTPPPITQGYCRHFDLYCFLLLKDIICKHIWLLWSCL